MPDAKGPYRIVARPSPADGGTDYTIEGPTTLKALWLSPPEASVRALNAAHTHARAELLPLLRRCEWAATAKGVGPCCPVCGNGPKAGHAPGCELGRAVGEDKPC